LIVTNRSDVAGRKISQDLGIVSGSIAPSRFIVRDIMATIRNMIGREMKEYTEMMDSAREIAIERMIKNAENIDADAIVNVRFSGSSASAKSSEIMAYGTAVRLEL